MAAAINTRMMMAVAVTVDTAAQTQNDEIHRRAQGGPVRRLGQAAALEGGEGLVVLARSRLGGHHHGVVEEIHAIALLRGGGRWLHVFVVVHCIVGAGWEIPHEVTAVLRYGGIQQNNTSKMCRKNWQNAVVV